MTLGLVRVSIFESKKDCFSTKTQRCILRLVPWVNGVKERELKAWKDLNLRTGELGLMVLQWQGHQVKTLRGGGSFRCS
jgi:hypothetical protein